MRRTALVLLFFLFSPALWAGDKRYSVPIGDSPSLGPANAPVTVIEFIDFQ